MTTCCTCSGATSGALQRGLDGDAAELGRRQGREAAAELADRGAGGAEDHGLGHGSDDSLRRWSPGHHRRARRTPAPTRSSSASSTARGSRTTSRTARSARWWSPARRARASARSPHAHAGGQALDPRRLRRRATSSTPSARGSPRPSALGRARELGARSLCWELPHKVPDAVAGALVEGTLLAAYRYTAFKSEPGEDRAPAEPDRLRPPRRRRGGRAAAASAPTAANRARDLGTRRPNVLTPEALAARARALAGREVDVHGPGGDRGGRAWARSPRSRRAPPTSRS